MTNTNNRFKENVSFRQKFIRRCHIIWAGTWWLIGFIFLFPFFSLCIWVPGVRILMPALNQIWCYIFFPMAFLRVRTVGKNHIPKRQPVIFVSNHGSYLDIPLLTYVLPGFPAFMGKASLGKIPVFGFMFRNLHIVVERGSQQGRAKALKTAGKMLKRGRSIIIFPEGSIHHKIQPGLAEFRDGAFKLAVQYGIPIVPVTICFNWYILPDDGHWLPRFYYCKTIIHSPLESSGASENDWNHLKASSFYIINRSLEIENKALIQQIQREN